MTAGVAKSIVVLTVFLAGANAAGSDHAPPTTVPSLSVECRKPDDAVRIAARGPDTVVDIRSPAGISGAVIGRGAGRWPPAVLLRIHLKGLESLTLDTGGITLRASVQSHGDDAVRLEIRQAGKAFVPLKRDDPCWMQITARDADGKAVTGLPPDGGWFEMTVPATLLDGRPKTLTMQWIDFYR